MNPTTLEELATFWEQEAKRYFRVDSDPYHYLIRCARELREFSACQSDSLTAGILRIANECNCRAEHGADGAEHLLAIEKMLRALIERPKGVA